jgi:hypothetical protein
LGSVSAVIGVSVGGGGGGVVPPNGLPSARLPGDAALPPSVSWRTKLPAGSASGLRFIDTPSLAASAWAKVTDSMTFPALSASVTVSPVLVS